MFPLYFNINGYLDFYKKNFHKKTCLLFGLCIALFIFNLFGKNFYWLMVLFVS